MRVGNRTGLLLQSAKTYLKRRPFVLAQAIRFSQSLLVRAEKLSPASPLRNIINSMVLEILSPFAISLELEIVTPPSVKRKESVLQFSLGATLDVGVNTVKGTVTIQPGGKAVNHYRSCRGSVGIPSTLICLISRDSSGRTFRELLGSEEGLWVVECPGSVRVDIDVDDKLHAPPGPRVRRAVLDQAMREFERQVAKHDWIVLAGSLYPGIPKDTYVRILRKYGEMQKVVVDSRAIADEDILGGPPPFILKPNMEEFAQLASRYYPNEARDISENSLPEDVLNLAQRMVKEKGVSILAITKDEKPFIVVTTDAVLRITPPQITLDSGSGSGDAFIVGMLDVLTRYKIGNDRSGLTQEILIEAVKRGTALATASAELPGTTFSTNQVRIQALEQQVLVEVIQD